jgi:hypothetical protein
LCYLHFLLYKSHLNIYKIPVAFFPSLKQNSVQTCCSFKSAIFPGMPNLQMYEHMYLTRHYSTITHAADLFCAGNNSTNSTLSTPSGRSLC